MSSRESSRGRRFRRSPPASPRRESVPPAPGPRRGRWHSRRGGATRGGLPPRSSRHGRRARSRRGEPDLVTQCPHLRPRQLKGVLNREDPLALGKLQEERTEEGGLPRTPTPRHENRRSTIDQERQEARRERGQATSPDQLWKGPRIGGMPS